jgi:hypothetical protein
MRKVRLDLTRVEADALLRLTQRGFDEIEDGDYDGRERWAGRADALRVLALVRQAAHGPGWAARRL